MGGKIETGKVVAGQSEQLTDFDETTHSILKIFFGQPGDVSLEQVAHQVAIEQSIVAYHFDLLSEAGFIIQTQVGVETSFDSSPPMFAITAAGRKYVVKNRI